MTNISDLYERSEYLINKLDALRFKKVQTICDFLYIECGYKNPEELPKVDSSWKNFSDGMTWGGKRDLHCWFYKKITVPKNTEDGTYILRFKTQKEGWDTCNPQFTLYINGKLKQGLDTNHTYVVLDCSGEIEVLLYAYSGTSVDSYLILEGSLEYIHNPVKDLYFDLKVPFDTLSWSDKNAKGYAELVQSINNALKIVDFREYYSQSFIESCNKAREYVKENIYKKSLIKKPLVSMIGHTHIDVIWLWTLEQTAEKTERSFATVMELMKLYPEFTFMSSQPALYNILKSYSPKLYENIKEKVKAGRWECEGGAFVEPDCNLTSGESLIRQVLYGKKFFRDEFKVDNNVLWLPDVFGYAACMPQILKKSGINYFLTSKISWNDTNQMPYDLFSWRGIDGTEIITYFITTQNMDMTDSNRFTTYVGLGTPSHIAGTYRRFQQKELTDNVAQLMGFGDGGGGVTHDMLETVRRLNDTDLNCPNAQIKKPSEFFALLESDIKNKNLPVWQGELYLEYHRGTYTSVSEVKKNNRKAEFALNNTEFFMSLNGLKNGTNVLEDNLDSTWQTLLLNQFHDVLPGSSIGKVYERAAKDFKEIFSECKRLSKKYIENNTVNGNVDCDYIIYNPNGVNLSGNVIIDGKTCYVNDIPAKGYKAIESKDLLHNNSIIATENLLENTYFKILFDDNYNIVSLYDKMANRELVKTGRVSGLTMFEDFAKDYDAWEIRKYYTEKQYCFDKAEFLSIVDDGVRKGLKIKFYYQKSTVVHTIYLYENHRLIDFDTIADWHEINTILKFILPAEINTDKAICNIQFGDIERPTHSNTSWDGAKFEVCAQKYAVLSDNGYSIGLLNDCKYGYGFLNNDLSLTLLKCSTFPFDGADIGCQQFKFAIATDDKAYINSDIYNVACEYNNPLIAIKQETKKTDKENYSLVSADKENIVIETVKPAIDGLGYVIRLFDRANKLSDVKLNFGFDFSKLYLCDMLENKLNELNVLNDSVNIKVKPYEIVTLKVEL